MVNIAPNDRRDATIDCRAILGPRYATFYCADQPLCPCLSQRGIPMPGSIAMV